MNFDAFLLKKFTMHGTAIDCQMVAAFAFSKQPLKAAAAPAEQLASQLEEHEEVWQCS